VTRELLSAKDPSAQAILGLIRQAEAARKELLMHGDDEDPFKETVEELAARAETARQTLIFIHGPVVRRAVEAYILRHPAYLPRYEEVLKAGEAGLRRGAGEYPPEPNRVRKHTRFADFIKPYIKASLEACMASQKDI
jgi:hypothetical protein